MPNSFQKDVEISAGLVSLPVFVSAAGLPREDDDDDDRDSLPSAINRSLLRDANESRLRPCGGASELDGELLVCVPLIPSSPTVACRISSKNVHRPSRRSDAICLPVRTKASREGGGRVLCHCESRCSGTWLSSSCAFIKAGLLRSTDGNVADRGVRPTRSSERPSSPREDMLGPETGDKRDNVRVCVP